MDVDDMTLREFFAQRDHVTQCWATRVNPEPDPLDGWADCLVQRIHYSNADAEIATLAARDDVAIVGTTDPADAMRMFGAECRVIACLRTTPYMVLEPGESVWVLPGEPTE